MNRSASTVFGKLRKRVRKAVKSTRGLLLSLASYEDMNELTAKELKKKFPKKTSTYLASSKPITVML